MGIYRSEIADLRKNICDNIGQKIIVKESPGKRSKPQEKVAVIENTYKDYFRVKFEEVDLFTRTVEVKLYNGEEYAPILPPQVETKKHRVNTVNTNPAIENA